MVFRKRTRGRDSDFADGRAFGPLDLRDGRPRIMITVDTATVMENGMYPVHVDYWNGVEPEQIVSILHAAEEMQIETNRQRDVAVVRRSDSKRSIEVN